MFIKYLQKCSICLNLYLSLVGRFASRLLAWFLSRILKASVGFRVAGCNCLRDVNLKFRKVCLSHISVVSQVCRIFVF